MWPVRSAYSARPIDRSRWTAQLSVARSSRRALPTKHCGPSCSPRHSEASSEASTGLASGVSQPTHCPLDSEQGAEPAMARTCERSIPVLRSSVGVSKPAWGVDEPTRTASRPATMASSQACDEGASGTLTAPMTSSETASSTRARIDRSLTCRLKTQGPWGRASDASGQAAAIAHGASGHAAQGGRIGVGCRCIRRRSLSRIAIASHADQMLCWPETAEAPKDTQMSRCAHRTVTNSHSIGRDNTATPEIARHTVCQCALCEPGRRRRTRWLPSRGCKYGQL